MEILFAFYQEMIAIKVLTKELQRKIIALQHLLKTPLEYQFT